MNKSKFLDAISTIQKQQEREKIKMQEGVKTELAIAKALGVEFDYNEYPGIEMFVKYGSRHPYSAEQQESLMKYGYCYEKGDRPEQYHDYDYYCTKLYSAAKQKQMHTLMKQFKVDVLDAIGVEKSRLELFDNGLSSNYGFTIKVGELFLVYSCHGGFFLDYEWLFSILKCKTTLFSMCKRDALDYYIFHSCSFTEDESILKTIIEELKKGNYHAIIPN